MIKAIYTTDLIETENDEFCQGGSEAESLLHELLVKHEEFAHLIGVNIKILLSKKGMKSKGRALLGKAILHSKKDRFYHPYQFTIILDYQFWHISPAKRKPLLYHELCHCGFNADTAKFELVPHDVEEFHAVIRNYGDWLGEAQRLHRQIEAYFSRCRANNKGLIETSHKTELRLIDPNEGDN